MSERADHAGTTGALTCASVPLMTPDDAIPEASAVFYEILES
jgi:hypothetical protein